MALLNKDAFNLVFSKWNGSKAKIIYPGGNVGDSLIRAGTEQLFNHFNIRESNTPDVVFYGGGGNIGPLYPNIMMDAYSKAKSISDQFRIPLIILPQTISGPFCLEVDEIFVRDKKSLVFYKEAILAPDLALAYEKESRYSNPIYNVGYFFRGDRERTFTNFPPKDPAYLVKTYQDYLALAASYSHIHTNRLHFAIAGLIVGRKVTLYPNSYHKNHSVWESWLKDLGCEWRDH